MIAKKSIYTLLALALYLICGCAHAGWYFFIIPGSVTSKISDFFSGQRGDYCVDTMTNVGDVLTSPAGNKAVVKSLSRESDRCPEPKRPIRAEIEFQTTMSSKAGIDLPDAFKPIELSEMQRFNGVLLNASDGWRNIGLFISARPRASQSDGGVLARNITISLQKSAEDGKVSNEEILTINGMRAYRFKFAFKNKGLFGRSLTKVVTVLESEQEFVIVDAGCRTDDIAEYESVLKKFAFDITGLTENVTPVGDVAETRVDAIIAAPVIGASVSRSPEPPPSQGEQPPKQ